jgi:hypothetical protein
VVNLKMGSCELFSRTALELLSHDLGLPSSWDYRRECFGILLASSSETQFLGWISILVFHSHQLLLLLHLLEVKLIVIVLLKLMFWLVTIFKGWSLRWIDSSAVLKFLSLSQPFAWSSWIAETAGVHHHTCLLLTLHYYIMYKWWTENVAN